MPSDGIMLIQSPHKHSKIKAHLYLQQRTGPSERQNDSCSGITRYLVPNSSTICMHKNTKSEQGDNGLKPKNNLGALTEWNP